jgi:hypothetical protein
VNEIVNKDILWLAFAIGGTVNLGLAAKLSSAVAN